MVIDNIVIVCDRLSAVMIVLRDNENNTDTLHAYSDVEVGLMQSRVDVGLLRWTFAPH